MNASVVIPPFALNEGGELERTAIVLKRFVVARSAKKAHLEV